MKITVAFALVLTLCVTGLIAGHAEAGITGPTPGSTLSGGTVTFTWSAVSGTTQYWLQVGSTLGADDLYGDSQGLNLSKTVSGLPTDGRTVYVRLWTDKSGTWRSTDVTYTAAGGGGGSVGITSPTAGSTLSGGTVTFTWSAVGGTTQYWLQVGSTLGADDLYGDSQGLNLSKTVSGLPTDGRTVYVRLWTDKSGTWRSTDVTYIASIAITGNASSTTTTSTGKAYYTATTGNDSNPGTQALPFRTISRGVKILKAGDTLLIRGGLYTEAIHDVPSGTSWSAPVTVAAYPGETVTVKPGAEGWPFVYLYNRSYIVMDGLTFDGSTMSSTMEGIFLDANAHHIRIQNSEVKNSPSSGVFIDSAAHHNEFINIAVHDNGVNDFDHGFYIEGTNNLVEDSDIYRNGGWGVHIYAGGNAGVANNNVIRHNRIYDNARVGRRGAGIILSSGNWNMVYNNLIWGNTGGIQIGYGTPTGTEVYNNTLYANRDYGIKIHSDGTNSVVKNNILYQNETLAYGTQFSNAGKGTQQSNNLTGTDPKFVDIAARDFHLRSGSVAIDQGVSVGVVTTDFDGTARPQGAAMDVGAMEFID